MGNALDTYTWEQIAQISAAGKGDDYFDVGDRKGVLVNGIVKVSDGKELGMVETVTYVKIGSSGDFAIAKKENATGVVFDGTTYGLIGHDEIQNAETVIVSEIDGGTAVSHQQSAINEMIQTILEG